MSPSPQNDDEANPEAPLFRIAKKRKLHQRQRRDHSLSPPTISGTAGSMSRPGELLDPSAGLATGDQDVPDGPLAPHVRATKPRKRLGGIEFSAGATNRSSSSAAHALTTLTNSTAGNEDSTEVPSLSSRFAPSTGVMRKQEDEERYLTAYIDSHLNPVSSDTAATTTETKTLADSHLDAQIAPGTAAGGHSAALPVAKQPALIGKLQEIDLGPSARRRNEKATLKASRALSANATGTSSIGGKPLGSSSTTTQHENDDNEDEDEDSDEDTRKRKKLPPKIRVNRYGRILQPRRPRRGAERSERDVERDKLIEEMLKTGGKVEKGHGDDGGGSRASNAGRGDEKDGDEELVELFRREFVENARAHAHSGGGGGGRGAAVAAAGGKRDESKTTGPKMGGSRSARSQMHQQGGASKGR